MSNYIGMEVGNAKLVLRLASKQLIELQKTWEAIPDPEMKEAAKVIINRARNATEWLREQIVRAEGGEPIAINRAVDSEGLADWVRG